jgi:hypothetical protein
MSENKTNTEEKDYEVDIITSDAMIDVKMSSGFYNRVRILLQNIIESHTSEELDDAHEQIKSKTITEKWVFDYETLLILCKDFETKAKDLGFVKKVPYSEAVKLMAPEDTEDESSEA